ALVGDSSDHAQALLSAIVRGILGDLDAGDVVEAFRLLQEEAVCTADVEQPPAVAMAADEVDGAAELVPQHRPAAAIIGVAVGMAPGEIVVGVIGTGVEAARLRAAEAALLAPENVAAVLGIEKPVLGRGGAGGAGEVHEGTRGARGRPGGTGPPRARVGGGAAKVVEPADRGPAEAA